MNRSIISAGIISLCATPVFAQDSNQQPTAQAMKPASEILAIVEARPDFARLDEMSRDDEGFYEVRYRTADKARVEINLDASGQPVDR